MKISLKNISPVALKTAKPGSVFQVPGNDEGNPAELYWRKRLQEGAVEIVAETIVSEPDPDPESVTEPLAPPAASLRSKAKKD